MGVGTSIMDYQYIPSFHLRKRPVYGELVVVLAEAACNIIDVVTGTLLLSKDSYMMISSIDRRTHEVGHRCVQSHIVLVFMCNMPY